MRENLAEQDIVIEVKNHPDSLFAGAIGAAIWGAIRHDKLLKLGRLEVAS